MMTLATDFAGISINPTVLFYVEPESGEPSFWSGPHPLETGGKD